MHAYQSRVTGRLARENAVSVVARIILAEYRDTGKGVEEADLMLVIGNDRELYKRLSVALEKEGLQRNNYTWEPKEALKALFKEWRDDE